MATTHRCLGLLAILAAIATLAGAATPDDPTPMAAPAPAPATAAETGPDAPEPPASLPLAPLSYRFDEVVVAASRLPESGFDLPYAVDTLTCDQVRDHAYRTSPDALRDLPGVMVQKTALGHGSPYIRGFTSFRNLFLVDGIRLNNSVFRDGPNQYWNTVDPLSVSRYEIVKGPGSVLYGTDAVGGTVNAVTKRPAGYDEGFHYGGRLSYRLSSAEQSNLGRLETWATWDHTLGVYFGGSLKHFGDLKGGHGVGTQDETGYGEWDLDFKIEYFLNPDTRIVAAHQSVRQDEVPRTHSTIYGLDWRDLVPGNELARNLWQKRDLTYLQLHAENLEGWIESMRLSLSWQEQNERRERLRWRGPRIRKDNQGFDAGTVGFWAQFESPSPVGRLVYGLDLYHDNVNSFATGNLIQGPVADNASYDQTGLFLQDTLAVTDHLDVILAGRYEHVRAKADRVQDPITGGRIRVSTDWEAFVSSGRAVVHLDRAAHWNAFAGVSQAFRAPNLSDLTRLDVARTNEIETPSPGLDPEHFLSYECGVKADYDHLALQFAYFYTVIDDMIVRTPTGRIIGRNFEVTKQNAGDGFVQGIELAGTWRFLPQLSAFGNLTWMDGEVNTFPTAAPVDDREPLDRLMPTSGQIGFRWDHPNPRLWAEIAASIADSQDDLSTRDRADISRIPPRGTPGYAVLSLRAGWQVRDNLNFTFAIENVTNEDYRIHGSGLNEPGRNFVFAAELIF